MDYNHITAGLCSVTNMLSGLFDCVLDSDLSWTVSAAPYWRFALGTRDENGAVRRQHNAPQEMGAWQSREMVPRYAHLTPEQLTRHTQVIDQLMVSDTTPASKPKVASEYRPSA